MSACKRVGVVHRSQAAEVVALRRVAYLNSPKFVWNDPATLDWGVADDEAVVMGVWGEDDRLLSTLRASVMRTRDEIESFLEYSLEGVDAGLPALVLSRAATLPDKAGHMTSTWIGLGKFLALPATAVQCIALITYEGGSRMQALQNAGYEFHEPRKSWDSEAKALARPLLAILRRERFDAALATVRAKTATQHLDVHIEVDAIAQALNAAAAR